MEIFCLEEFKSEYDKLKKNNSYKDLEKTIIDFFFSKTPDDFIKVGNLLNGTRDAPFIKKKIKGRGGWRFYYLVIIKKDKLYLMYLHPKRGSAGIETIGPEFEKDLYNTVLKEITADNLYTVTVADNRLVFEHNLLKSSGEENKAQMAKELLDKKDKK